MKLSEAKYNQTVLWQGRIYRVKRYVPGGRMVKRRNRPAEFLAHNALVEVGRY